MPNQRSFSAWKSFFALLQLGISLGLLALLFRQFPREAFFASQDQLAPRPIITAGLCFAASFLLTSFNWYYILAALGVKASYRRVLLTNLAGLFYGTVIPSALSGDVARGLRLYQSAGTHVEIALSVVIDRLTGLIVFAGVFGIGVIVYLDRLPLEIQQGSGRVILLLAVALVGLLGGYVLLKLFPNFFVRFAERIHTLRGRWDILLIATVITMVVHVLVAAMLWALSSQFWEKPSLFYCLFIIEILNIAELLPISVAGLGIREGLYVILLEPFGVELPEAVLISLTQFLIVLCVAGIGGLYEAQFFLRSLAARFWASEG